MLIRDLTMEEFSAGLKKTRTLLIPFGSTEEHGAHLPLDTDTLQAVDVGAKLAARRDLFVAPPLHYGVCRSTRNHPGTISLTTATLIAVVIDLVSDFRRQGLRHFILLSGHAGGTHMAALTDAGEQLLERFSDIGVAVLCEYQLVLEAAGELIETPHDSHGGEIETSRLLHSHPHLVKGRSKAEYPEFPDGILVRDKRRYWPGGIWGDPGKASAGKGAAIETLVVERLAEIVDRLESTTSSSGRL